MRTYTNESALVAPCEGNSPVIGEFPTQRVSNAKGIPFDDVIMILSIPIK